MSEQEMKRRKIAGTVMSEAWKLIRKAAIYGWSTILKLAWRVVRSRTRLHYTKAVGVSVSGTPRQARLRNLVSCRPEDVSILLVREQDNRFDCNAVRVVVSTNSTNGYTIGYLKAPLAAVVAPMMDEGRQVVAVLEQVTGTGSKGLYGMNLKYAVI